MPETFPAHKTELLVLIRRMLGLVNIFVTITPNEVVPTLVVGNKTADVKDRNSVQYSSVCWRDLGKY